MSNNFFIRPTDKGAFVEIETTIGWNIGLREASKLGKETLELLNLHDGAITGYSITYLNNEQRKERITYKYVISVDSQENAESIAGVINKTSTRYRATPLETS